MSAQDETMNELITEQIIDAKPVKKQKPKQNKKLIVKQPEIIIDDNISETASVQEDKTEEERIKELELELNEIRKQKRTKELKQNIVAIRENERARVETTIESFKRQRDELESRLERLDKQIEEKEQEQDDIINGKYDNILIDNELRKQPTTTTTTTKQIINKPIGDNNRTDKNRWPTSEWFKHFGTNTEIRLAFNKTQVITGTIIVGERKVIQPRAITYGKYNKTTKTYGEANITADEFTSPNSWVEANAYVLQKASSAKSFWACAEYYDKEERAWINLDAVATRDNILNDE